VRNWSSGGRASSACAGWNDSAICAAKAWSGWWRWTSTAMHRRLSVGEPRELTRKMIAEVLPAAAADKPRYVWVWLSGLDRGYARMGVDMMTGVATRRRAPRAALHHGTADIKGGAMPRTKARPIRLATACLPALLASYLRHLMRAGEALSGTLTRFTTWRLPGNHGAGAQSLQPEG